MAQSKILCVVPDSYLRERWAMALIAAGHDVVATSVAKHAAQLLNGEKFDLVLIGFGSTRREKESLAKIARAKHKTLVLIVCAVGYDFLIPADQHISGTAGEDSLVTAVTRLSSRSKLPGRRATALARAA